MKNDYIAEKERKGKSTNQGIIFLTIFILLFLFVILRIALRSGLDDIFSSSMPSERDAFTVAKDYVKPTVSPSDIQFTDDAFLCYQRPDSVFIIKSSFKANAAASKNNFSITLKFHGGDKLNDANWSVISLIEGQ